MNSLAILIKEESSWPSDITAHLNNNIEALTYKHPHEEWVSTGREYDKALLPTLPQAVWPHHHPFSKSDLAHNHYHSPPRKPFTGQPAADAPIVASAALNP